MKVDHWEEKTVSSFLEYIYAEKLTMVVTKDKDTVELTRITLGSNDYIYKRSFDKTKLTLQLFEMAHMYRVKDLQMDCVEHIKANLSDDDVIEVWLTAEKCDCKSLSSAAIKYFVDIPRPLMTVPGFADLFETHTHLKDLLNNMKEKNTHLKDLLNNMKEKMDKLQEEN